MASFTSKDVARAAGVSQSTVSYVLTGKRPISEKTRRRVLDAIEQLTYEPNAGARALASQRSRVIGLFVPFESGHDMTGLLPFIETITKSARAREHEVILVTSDEGSAGLRRLAGRSLCDAMVLMDIQRVDDRVPVAASLSTPVILIGVPDDPAGLYCADLDFPEAARMVVAELARTGHERVVFVGYSPEDVERDLNYVRRFLEPALRAADDAGLARLLLSPVPLGRQSARDCVRRAIEFGEGARLGIVVPNSLMVQPVLHALRRHGVEPGRDVSVIGLCTDSAASDCEPPVSNVSLEPREVSSRAMDTLFWLLDPTPTGPPPAIDLVSPHLTHRETTLPPE